MAQKLDRYSELLLTLVPNYRLMTVADYLSLPVPDKRVAVIIHRAESRPEAASRMALWEKQRGIHSTYYFPWDPRAVNWAGAGEARFGNFPELAVVEAKLYGHEVGYLPSDGDHAMRLAVLRELAPVRTAFTDAPDVMGGPYSPEFSDFFPVENTRRGWSVDGARSNYKSVLALLKAGKHPRLLLSVDPAGWK